MRSSLLRGGVGGFSIVPVARERGVESFELELSFSGESPRSLVCACGSFGSLLFDNRIGRKRDVGGGVLAGLWSAGRLLSASLGQIRRLESEETTDGHVSTIHRASKGACRTAVRRTAWFCIEADVLELVKIQCSPEH